MIRSPIRWVGGKGKIVTKILPLFPSHRCYVEPFGGGASLLLAKSPAQQEVYNDLNPDLVGLFRDLQQHGLEVLTSVALTPFSRREQRHARERLNRSAADMIVAHRQSFGGKVSGYGIDKTTAGEISTTVRGYLQAIQRLPRLTQRLRRVELRSQDALEVIREFDSLDTLHYLDPPYVLDSWTGEDIYYGHNMSLEQHQKLVELILTVKGMVVLSGYPNDCYAPLAGWTIREFPVSCSVAARTESHRLKGTGKVKAQQPRTECLWLNAQATRRTRSTAPV